MKYQSVLIITYGRSGSTLLQGVLNSIDGVLVRGENKNLCFHLFQSYRSLVYLKNVCCSVDLPSSPWFGNSIVSEQRFLYHMKTMVKELLLVDKLHDDTIRCYGFKEIRYDAVMEFFFDYLEFLKRIFPEVAFIFNTRNLDDVVKSSWFAEQEPAKLKKKLLTLESLFTQYCHKHGNGFQISYEDVVSKSKRLESMFEFLGVSYEPQKIDNVLARPHSYESGPKQRQKNIFRLHEILHNIPDWSETYQKEKDNKIILERLIGSRRRLCEHYIRIPEQQFQKELASSKEAYLALMKNGIKSQSQPLPQEEQDFLNEILAQDCSHPKSLPYLFVVMLYCLPHQLPKHWCSHLFVPTWATDYLYAWLNLGIPPQVPKIHAKGGKIFCIGLNKTGTTSLHAALRILGFSSIHHVGPEGNIKDIIAENLKNKRALLAGIERYDAYSDWNHPHTNLLYQELDRQYPGSKFIFTTRHLEEWLESRERHVRRTPHLRELQKKHPASAWYHINKAEWRKELHELQTSIELYFSNRPEDLLLINIPAGDGWGKLCPFVGKDIPNVPFPHRGSRKMMVD